MKLIWTDSSVRDLEVIKNYISIGSDIYSINFVHGIINIVEKPSNFPARGRRVSEANNENVCELIYLNYRIINKIKQESVFILSIVHCARSLNNNEIKPWDNL